MTTSCSLIAPVQVALLGHRRPVVALARALASLVDISAVAHHVQGDDAIRLDTTCHLREA